MIPKRCGTWRKAREQAQWISKKGKELRAYYSSMCHTYHLTSEIEFTGRKAKRFK